MLDISEMTDLTLKADAKVKQWKSDYETRYNRPVLAALRNMIFDNLDAKTIANLQETAPEAMDKLNKSLGGYNAPKV